MKRWTPFSLLFVLLLLVLAACGGAAEEALETTAPEESAPASEMANPVEASGVESGDVPPPPPEGGEKVAEVRVDAVVEAEPAVAEAPRAVGEEAAVGDTAVAPAEPVVNQNSQLTAGEVDDNAQWDDYLLYLRSYSGASVIRMDVSERHQIWVQDSQGRPVLGAKIDVVANGQTMAVLRSGSNGRALFFPRTLPTQADLYTLNITVAGQTETVQIPANSVQREWFVTHPGADQLPATTQLDILFLIDATGSMSDEINQLKENIRAISSQINALPNQPAVRFAMVTYRDRGDSYLYNVTDFTPDINEFAQSLANVSANGGGDYPEDLNEAFSQAVHSAEWRVEDTVSLIFLVADAPPHLDYGQQNHYGVEVMEALARGIKVYPIASSGLDEQGEYIFRQLAQMTGGRFIFLTYGDAGPGSTGTETTFNVSDYSVSALDDLVVRIVEEELSYRQ